ncbi:MAG: hypothetical protein IH943_10895 [Acidobacteria bacterium]|nr:hypothetical protein [Acidobacteriota bacterium]
MRTSIVTTGDLRDGLADRDVERLLAGESPVSQDHAPIVSLVSALVTFGDTTLQETLVDEYSKLAAQLVRESRPAPITETTRTGTRHYLFGLKRRAVAGLTALVMISGMTGVAWASDGAVPGDWNYGIDRALESFGIGNGGAEERLQELAQILDGQPSDKTRRHAPPSESIGDPDAGPADAAESVTRQGSDSSLAVRSGVSEILRHLFNGEEIDDAAIAEMARTLAGQHGPPEDPPANQQASAPHPGRPSDPGKP